MAKNNEVVVAFLSGDTKGKASSISIEGDKLYSYKTVIAQRVNGAIVINTTKYSQSTTVIQNRLLGSMPNARTAENVPMGAYNIEPYIVKEG